MLLNDNNNLIKKVTFFYDSKNTNMAGPPSSQSELSYEHTYLGLATLSNSQSTNIPSISTEGSRIRIVSETYNLIVVRPSLDNQGYPYI